MKLRNPKHNDQNNIEIAYSQLIKLINSSSIESTLWVSAIISAVVKNYIISDISYNQFCEDLDEMKIIYKNWWD